MDAEALCVLCGCRADIDVAEPGPVDRSCFSALQGNLLGSQNPEFLAMKQRLWARYRAVQDRYRSS